MKNVLFLGGIADGMWKKVHDNDTHAKVTKRVPGHFVSQNAPISLEDAYAFYEIYRLSVTETAPLWVAMEAAPGHPLQRAFEFLTKGYRQPEI